jgi:hypothetical protein
MRTPESPANALRRKIQRKIELVSKWERKENECVGTDPVTEIKADTLDRPIRNAHDVLLWVGAMTEKG